MPAKTTSRSDQLPVFKGLPGKRRLRECLRRQPLTAGDEQLARLLERAGQLVAYKPGEILSSQGDATNHIMLIVHGEVTISINNRQVATRTAGEHVGEMALVDPQVRRSATITASVPTVVLTVSEHRFSAIANSTPELWRRIASEIAQRLRERSSAIRIPNEQPVVFIGSSSEASPILESFERFSGYKDVVPQAWTNGVFEASKTTIENLVAITQKADFAILLLTSDDITVSRGRKKASPRDNVVFELGLLMGSLGRERVFMVAPKRVDLRIPTDLLGVTWI
jgi:CRP/FNR family cyclic AMP-dependent transcriptional regulator